MLWCNIIRWVYFIFATNPCESNQLMLFHNENKPIVKHWNSISWYTYWVKPMLHFIKRTFVRLFVQAFSNIRIKQFIIIYSLWFSNSNRNWSLLFICCEFNYSFQFCVNVRYSTNHIKYVNAVYFIQQMATKKKNCCDFIFKLIQS